MTTKEESDISSLLRKSLLEQSWNGYGKGTIDEWSSNIESYDDEVRLYTYLLINSDLSESHFEQLQSDFNILHAACSNVQVFCAMIAYIQERDSLVDPALFQNPIRVIAFFLHLAMTELIADDRFEVIATAVLLINSRERFSLDLEQVKRITSPPTIKVNAIKCFLNNIFMLTYFRPPNSHRTTHLIQRSQPSSRTMLSIVRS